MVQEKLFVLKVSKHGESDLIVRCLNREGAKVSLFARAALKSKKRFGGGVLEPTHYILASYKPNRSGDGLAQLTEAKLINDFYFIRSDFDKLQAALHMVSLVEKFTQEGLSDNSMVFDLLGNSIGALETSTKLDLLRVSFEAKLLMSQGLLPDTKEYRSLVNRPIGEHSDISLELGRQVTLKKLLNQQIRESLS